MRNMEPTVRLVLFTQTSSEAHGIDDSEQGDCITSGYIAPFKLAWIQIFRPAQRLLHSTLQSLDCVELLT